MHAVKQGVAILGATGTIGINTLAVIAQHPEQFYVVALVANRNVALLLQQCQQCYPQYVVMADPASARQLELALKDSPDSRLAQITVLAGEQAACQVVALAEVTQVMSAIVGAAGLQPTLAAIKAGKRILLANKESLVTCGRLFMQAVAEFGAQILPIDSEHNAIFQSLSYQAQQQLGQIDWLAEGMSQIILTGSGGPFRQTPIEQLPHVTAKQACAHPNWVMGPKISVDSATMMNKGLEYIEACCLFNASASQMEILIHPQSVIHSMVRYTDGSVIAQLGTPDMQTPIAHALGYPNRLATQVTPLDFCQIQGLTFQPVDVQRYPCLQLAIDAYQAGQAATTALNAANEIAVAAFLDQQIGFTAIAEVNLACLQQANFTEPTSIEEVIMIDQQARRLAQQQLNHY